MWEGLSEKDARFLQMRGLHMAMWGGVVAGALIARTAPTVPTWALVAGGVGAFLANVAWMWWRAR